MVRQFGYWVFLSIMMLAGASMDAMAFEKSTVKFRFVDPSGGPVSFVTIWSADDFRVNGIASSVNNFYFTPDDLWRDTNRYSDSYELASSGYGPTDRIGYLELSDAKGEETHIFSHPRAGNPDVQTRAYSFIKRGYIPKLVIYKVAEAERGIDTVITMQPISGSSPQPAYVKTFERVRWEFSRPRENEKLTDENVKRLADLRSELEQAAGAAEAAGDKKTAALILARIQSMPEITILNGRISGYASQNLDSPANVEAFERAFSLDPDSPYLRMVSLMRKHQSLVASLAKPLAPQDRERLFQFVQTNYLPELARNGDKWWSFPRRGPFGAYQFSFHFQEAYDELQRLRAFEPHGFDFDKLLSTLKSQMQVNNLAVPPNWS